MLRAVKNENGVIIAIGRDEDQSGQYPLQGEPVGEWCSWVFEEMPELVAIEGADLHAMRFKENAEEDGIELRSDEEVLESPFE